MLNQSKFFKVYWPFSRREISFEEGDKFAQNNNMIFIETSAKTGVNVEKTFTSLGERIYQKLEKGIIDVSHDVTFSFSEIFS